MGVGREGRVCSNFLMFMCESRVMHEVSREHHIKFCKIMGFHCFCGDDTGKVKIKVSQNLGCFIE